MADFDRPSPTPSTTARKASIRKVPDDMFKWHVRETGLSEKYIKDLEAEHAEWANTTAQGHLLASLRTMANTYCKGDKKRLERTWMSLLLCPGTYASNNKEKIGGIVIASTKYGVLLYLSRANQANGIIQIELNKAPIDPIKFCVVEDLADWKSMELNMFCPGEDIVQVPDGIKVPQCCAVTAPTGIVESSLNMGFKGLTKAFLQQLYNEMQLGIGIKKKPLSEASIINAIAEKIWGDGYSDEALNITLKSRDFKFNAFVRDLVATSPLQQGDVDEILQEDMTAASSTDVILPLKE